jgi:hypothetical protein
MPNPRRPVMSAGRQTRDASSRSVAPAQYVPAGRRDVVHGAGPPPADVDLPDAHSTVYCSRSRACQTCYPPGNRYQRQIRRQVDFLIPAALSVLSVVVGFLVLRGKGDHEIGPWGIVEVLPWAYWVCLATPTLVFFRELARQANKLLLALALISQTVLIYGSVVFAESAPRFATAWLHAGFTNQILTTGQTPAGVDARFSWPGFFSGAAVFTSAAGVPPIDLLRWAPLCFGLAYLPPLALLFRALHGSARVRWAALWIFTVGNWVGQDYFAPQSFGFLLNLVVLSIVCSVFLGGNRVRLARARILGRLRALAAAPGDGQHQLLKRTNKKTQRGFLIVTLLVVFCAMAMSHQLTPFMLSSTLVMLVVTGSMRLKLLPVALLVITFGWLCYGAQDYWSGHLSTIFGDAGRVSSVVESGVGSRIVGSQVHQYIVNLRIGSAGFIWCVAALGALLMVRRRGYGLVAAVITGTPFLMLIVQAYGGEGILRIYLFSLPGAALLAAEVVVAAVSGRRLLRPVVTVLALCLLPTCLISRYGNESYERVRPTEAEAITALYAFAPPGSTLWSVAPNIAWRNNGLLDYNYGPTALGELALQRVDTIVSAMTVNPAGSFLVYTRSQAVYGEQVYGLPDDWGQSLQTSIEASGRFVIAYRNADAVVYELVAPKRTRARR